MRSCSEPEGNEEAGYVEGITKHEAMLDLTGQCPWCGDEEEA